jgi:hypothetical protein
MTEGQLQGYAEREFTELEQAYGKDLAAKLQSASRMIYELEKKSRVNTFPQIEGR